MLHTPTSPAFGVPSMRKIFVMFAAAAALTTAACNTVRGVGEDVETAGEAVADAAEDAKN